ncbi:ATP-binding protein [Aquamicrobium sp. LC103]|uniref:ATP-binding protein n=1 Tax=Aquamicrobium sp. LC103 TaxID=1120658 RepID=UPI00069A3F57|nr:ATP-binding protein [Aquamicrobium sp. LC103]TKT76741.1 sensor histidine kinase [Aquamicrobium sp. LC103]
MLNIFRAGRAALLPAGLGLIVGSSIVTGLFWERAAEHALRQAGEQRLSLVAASVRSTVLQNSHLPLAVALDPDSRDALLSPRDPRIIDKLNGKLDLLSNASSAAALYVMDANGLTIAASNWNEPTSFLGQNYSFRSYFTLAMEQKHGAFYAIGATTSRPGYFLSQAVEADGRVVGVAVVKVEFDEVEAVWADADESVLVTDANDIVFLASDAAWKYRALSPLSEDAQDEIARTQQYAGRPPPPLPLETVGGDADNPHLRVDGNERVFLSQSARLPELGWVVHHMTGTEPVRAARRDGMIIGASASALMLALVLAFMQRQRILTDERNARVLLEDRVNLRTRELTDANRQLMTEIGERERAEAGLRAAQAELLQAEKLAALGRMSAAIAHEVNQPLGAIRTSAASAAMLVARGEQGEVTATLDRIGQLAARAAAITGHLRAFARKGGQAARRPFRVDIALERAIDLSRNAIREAGLTLAVNAPAITALGSAVPFEQVAANLVRNSIDAVKGITDPRIQVTAAHDGRHVVVTVADNGPGFPEADLDKVFDPFFTTKEVNEGMGLGLSISYGIISEFSGSIRAENLPGGGARVTVRLDAARAEERL